MRQNAKTHQIRYKSLINRYPDLLNQKRYMDIELTNVCNLACKYCPSSTSKFHKGFIHDRIFKFALEYADPNSLFAYNGFGEPLLHPEFLKYVRWVTKRGIASWISTNGLLLTEKLLYKLLEIGVKGQLIISLHTKKSVETFMRVVKFFSKNNISNYLIFKGYLHPENINTKRWLEELGLHNHPRLQRIEKHNWAGNIPGEWRASSNKVTTRRKKNCWYIKNKLCSIRWDGTVVSCCLDSESINVLGHIENFPKLKHNPEEYRLCKYCPYDY